MTRGRPLALLVLIGVVFVALAVALRPDVEPASAAGGIVSIGVGGRHTCVVTEGATVRCWGENLLGQLGDGTTTNRSSPVDVCASGSGDGCSEGSLLTGVTAISTGFRHSCALLASGGVQCWGENNRGQLGDGTLENHPNPAHVCASGIGPDCAGGAPLAGVTEVEAGALFSCALMATGGINCWGNGDEGQLGAGAGVADGTGLPVEVCAPTSTTPAGGWPSGIDVPCEPLTHFTTVTAGRAFACGLTTNGGVRCWGRSTRGRLGAPGGGLPGHPVDVCGIESKSPSETSPSGLPCDPLGDIVDVEAGTSHTCALSAAGQVACWGDNSGGALGDGTAAPFRTRPVSVCAGASDLECERLTGIDTITAGNSHTCAISDVGAALCWGANFRGMLGNGTTDDSANPVAVAQLGGVRILGGGPGSRHNCATTLAGLSCWGYNLLGQLGLGSADDNAHPLPVLVPVLQAKPSATSQPTATPTPGDTVGDVDCSSAVNAIDVALLLQFIAGLVPDLPCQESADANEDGTVNTIDAALILQFTAGLLDTLPP